MPLTRHSLFAFWHWPKWILIILVVAFVLAAIVGQFIPYGGSTFEFGGGDIPQHESTK